jgi:small subunit ribosomal protein S21
MFRRATGKRPARVSVVTRKNESPDRLIRRFLRKVKKQRIVEQAREGRFFEKPSVKRRKKRLKRERTLKKLEQNENK